MEKIKKTKIPYHKKPEELSLEEWQRELRKQFISDKRQRFKIKYLGGEHPIFGDYSIQNIESGGIYKVALRSSKPGFNFCSCMDFKTNGLGTCKHIEAVFFEVERNDALKNFFKEEYKLAYSSMFLKYGKQREVMLRIGTHHENEYKELAKKYFDSEYHLLPKSIDCIENFLTEAGRISPDFRFYEDAVDFVLKARQENVRRAVLKKKIDGKYFSRLLKTTLYPYQQEGIVFTAKAGRALLADEMGLGKTLQAIGLAELLKKEFKIERVLIICPTSLKYQWKNEIEKFTNSSVNVIEGDALRRQKHYDTKNFYSIASYNVVGADIEAITRMEPDLVILDEAQRIKNWQTKTARQVKKIESKYALVLTGTPIENKLEELYSIIQFIDPFKLGPLYQFLSKHQIRDKLEKVVGYRELNKIQNLLSDTVIRRTKKQVMTELPKRTDKNLFVPMTEKQSLIHEEYVEVVARLVNKWKRFGFLDEKDRQRLLLSLNSMRMVSDSTYILDQETRHDTKISELMSILDAVFETNEEKVVIFSQWERMTRLVQAELEKRSVGFAYLHGAIPSQKRKTLIDDFNSKIECRVFLSTDAGSVGLNLQTASLLINLDIPWNPAVLEQRVGRIHRHGQKRSINIINLISKDSIEERMLDILAFKSSLFAGVLDSGANEIFMGESKFKRFMSGVEKMTVSQPTHVVPTTDVEENEMPETETTEKRPVDVSSTTDFFAGAASFLNSLSEILSDEKKIKTMISNFVATDTTTGKRYLKIPMENEKLIGDGISVLTRLLGTLKKDSAE